MNNQPIIFDEGKTHQYCCSAIGLQAVIIDKNEKILLLSSPKINRKGKWQVVSGALKSNETLLAGTLREIHEEIGTKIKVRPLGVIHAHTFHNDYNIKFMVGIYFLFEYKGGEIQTGDDMSGSKYSWWSMKEIEKEQLDLFIPRGEIWILRRGIDLYRIWKYQDQILQKPL